MENRIIEIYEDRVLHLNRDTQALNKILKSGDRTGDNYDHLGTLDCNLKVLLVEVKRLLEELDYPFPTKYSKE